MNTPRKFLKRRGRKGEAQAELWAALAPIVEKYWGVWPELETRAFLSLEAEAAINGTASKMRETATEKKLHAHHP